jgi:hypothetical protein
MERLRTPFFIVAMVAAGLAVLVELGATYLVGGGPADPGQLAQQVAGLGVDVPAGGQVGQPPGIAIPYLALIDVIVVFTVALMGAGMVVPDRLHGRLQGIITLIGAIILIITAIVLVFVALGELILMVTLLLAFPFGTIAYLIIWGSFPRGEAAVILSLLMFLKLVFAGCSSPPSSGSSRTRGWWRSSSPRWWPTWWWPSCTASCRASWSASPTPSPPSCSRSWPSSGAWCSRSGPSRRS